MRGSHFFPQEAETCLRGYIRHTEDVIRARVRLLLSQVYRYDLQLHQFSTSLALLI
jgi:hypothetical protein